MPADSLRLTINTYIFVKQKCRNLEKNWNSLEGDELIGRVRLCKPWILGMLWGSHDWACSLYCPAASCKGMRQCFRTHPILTDIPDKQQTNTELICWIFKLNFWTERAFELNFNTEKPPSCFQLFKFLI